MRKSHAAEYHAEAEATQNARASSNWTVEEKELLARAEATLVFEGNHRPDMINMQLSGMVGARSLQAIKGRWPSIWKCWAKDVLKTREARHGRSQ